MSDDIQTGVPVNGAFGRTSELKMPEHGDDCSMEEAGLLAPGTPGALKEPTGPERGIKKPDAPAARPES